MTRGQPITILMADDDEDDRVLTKDALAAARIVNDLHFVGDGVELLEYLRRQGRFADPGDSPAPGLVLLDLNMPRMDGREVLAEMKHDPALHRIPVVVLTTSANEEDVAQSYNLGSNSYIKKPVTFEAMVEVMRVLGQYWFQTVELP